MKKSKNFYLYVAIAILAIIYFVKDKIFVGGSVGGGSSSSSSDLKPEKNTNTYTAPTTDKDIDVWVKKGSKGSAVISVQKNFNSIIQRCKDSYLKDSYSKDNPTAINRFNHISKMTKLVVDGDFGSDTEKVCHYILNYKGTSKRQTNERLKTWKSITFKS